MYLDAIPTRTRYLHPITLETRVRGFVASLDMDSRYQTIGGELVVTRGAGSPNTRGLAIVAECDCRDRPQRGAF